MGMRTSKYSEEQIIGFLRQAEAGMPIKEIGRKHGFSDASFYKWRAKYGDMDVSEAKLLRYLPIIARQDWVAVLNPKGEVVGYLQGDGF